MLTHDMLECKEEENIIRQIEYQTNVMNHRDNKYKNNANKVDNIYQLLDTIIECNKTWEILAQCYYHLCQILNAIWAL